MLVSRMGVAGLENGRCRDYPSNGVGAEGEIPSVSEKPDNASHIRIDDIVRHLW